ncbi:MAG: hypothetical protein PVJ55_08900 [Anaerolineae bacterium]|jgi:hypothetical protein
MENAEQITQEEGTNRSFIILVAALGGLLVLGIGAFVAWALLVAPGMRADVESQNEAVFATNTAVAMAAAATETAAVTPTSTDTPVPTNTPPPTDTSTPRPTATSESDTPEATATSSLQTPTTTVAENSASTVPDTGIGVLGGATLAGGLAFLLVLIRRLRTTA